MTPTVPAVLEGPRRFCHREFSAETLVSAKKTTTVSVCLPARDEATTIGPIIETIKADLAEKVHLVDEIIVVDDRSADATAAATIAAGVIAAGVIAAGVIAAGVIAAGVILERAGIDTDVPTAKEPTAKEPTAKETALASRYWASPEHGRVECRPCVDPSEVEQEEQEE